VHTIAVINQKGGVGKTTTVANVGAALATAGRDVALIDMDPQAHLTLHFGSEPTEQTATVYDVLTGESGFRAATQMLTPNLWLLPTTTDLAAAESTLAGQPDRNTRLRSAIQAGTLPHDILILDCPPSLGVLTLNALAAADEVIIPLQPHFLAMQGLAKLLETITLVQRRLNPSLRVLGVVLCMYETVTRLGRDVVEEVRGFLSSARGSDTPYADARVFETVVRRNIRLAECPSYGQTIFEYDSRSHGAADYAGLARELLGMLSARNAPAPTRPQSTDSPPQPVQPPATSPADPPTSQG
jgi:chromosome partitioning protein